MAADPTKLDGLEMLSLIAHGLIPFMERVMAGEQDLFPYPEALLCGFNQLVLTCALQDVPRAQRSKSIAEFVANWSILPLSEWAVKLDIPADMFIAGDRLLDPDYDGSPTALYRKLSRGEVMPLTVKGATIADKIVNPKAIT